MQTKNGEKKKLNLHAYDEKRSFSPIYIFVREPLDLSLQVSYVPVPVSGSLCGLFGY